jgi:hypothetical protein
MYTSEKWIKRKEKNNSSHFLFFFQGFWVFFFFSIFVTAHAAGMETFASSHVHPAPKKGKMIFAIPHFREACCFRLFFFKAFTPPKCRGGGLSLLTEERRWRLLNATGTTIDYYHTPGLEINLNLCHAFLNLTISDF